MKVTIVMLAFLALFQTTYVHAQDDHYARGLVIQSLESNKFEVGGAEFKTKPNTRGEGIFVYDPRTNFRGVERHLIWLVIDDQAYPLNSPSKQLTPSLKWPREARPKVWKKTGLDPFQAGPAIKSVFGTK